MTLLILLTVSAFAANPFLDAKDDKQVSDTFRGNEWGDEIGSDEIPPDYFIVTDDRIVLLNEEDNDAAVKRISALDKPPQFEQNEIYAITSSKFDYEDGVWKTTIRLKGDLCIYDASHPSGHFKKIVWKKDVGLVEYASGYGAHADGYRLKRTATIQRR